MKQKPGAKGEEESKIRQRHKAIKTGGEPPPQKFTREGYLTCLPVPGRASTIPHARKKKKKERKKKEGNPNRREKRKEMKREEKSSFEEGE